MISFDRFIFETERILGIELSKKWPQSERILAYEAYKNYLKDSKDVENKTKWEMFFDESYYHTWCVRDEKDTRFNSPKSFHFNREEEAIAFINAVLKAI